VAFRRMRRQTSMVNMVEEELKTDVSDEMSADIITARIRPTTIHAQCADSYDDQRRHTATYAQCADLAKTAREGLCRLF